MVKKDASISLRVSADLKEALEKLAASEGRTLNNYVNRVFTEYLKDIENAKQS